MNQVRVKIESNDFDNALSTYDHIISKHFTLSYAVDSKNGSRFEFSCLTSVFNKNIHNINTPL